MGDANQALTDLLSKYTCPIHGGAIIVSGTLPTLRLFGCCNEFIRKMEAIAQEEIKKSTDSTDKAQNN